MKVMKRIVTTLLIFVILISAFILISYINHRVQLVREEQYFIPLGQQVDVGGRMMNVYSEGNGAQTLVFMSGGGTSSPVLDFKSLYSLLSDNYRIVVVEKFGYGFSDVADVDRDIASILSDTRTALAQADIPGPFVLCPHSMSGLEAIYWAQTYPDEITAIVGLDMAVPDAYDDYKVNLPMVKLGKFIADTGIIRWIPGVAESDAIRHGTLSDADQELYRTVFHRRTATQTMMNEVQKIKQNAALVGNNGDLAIPVLIFSSNGQGTGWDETEWRIFQRDYVAGLAHGRLIELDCSHYVHDLEYTRIADEMRMYLVGIN